MMRRWRQHFCPDLAIDLGTTSTRIARSGMGVALQEPSVVAVEKESRRVLGRGMAVGRVARQMLGRTPDGIIAARPLKDGVIHDFELCEAMLKYFLLKVGKTSFGMKPRVLITVPEEISPVERRAVFTAAERAGAGRVYVISGARAAGIGGGLAISEPMATMVCNIGGGTTEAAILSLGDVVAGSSLRTAGSEMDADIIRYLRRAYSLKISESTAERLKIEIGSAASLTTELTLEVNGLDAIGGIPRKAVVTSEDIREAIRPSLDAMVAGLKALIETCQPELIADLADVGLLLTGGGAQLRNIDQYLREQLGIPVRIAHDPQRTVIQGAATCLDHMDEWRKFFGTDD
ncbi:rod shape-determining protein [Calycomorphotria hydatis]|uniref:Cell shape-determining protein MreB n=1 Tax=Calycomorphotria hydatis TaxID=2528027 RepID=A0A517TB07_9PLAN|nr:rod shape-determining protein [Calycomorphotria hydatis]QDT65554.1 Rod shape-determining protein MreB [Calycomorphotria hydatis]